MSMQSVTCKTSAIDMPVATQQAPTPVWRIINFAMAIFFFLAAYANANDDDWYLWVPIYAVPALLSVAASIRPSLPDNSIWQIGTAVVFLFCVLFGIHQIIALLNALSSTLENPLSHEEGREMGGLLIILAWAGISRFSPVMRSNGDANSYSLFKAMLWIAVTLAILPLFTWSLCFVGDWHKHMGHCNNMFKS